MQLNLKEIPKSQKAELVAMLLAYFRAIDPSKIRQTPKGEKLDYPYLDAYWQDPERLPLKIVLEGEVVGFVLINNWVRCVEFNAEKSVAEFYVKPTHRRKGLGTYAAHKLFSMFRGKWEVRQSQANVPAVKFWRRVITDFTRGKFAEVTKGDYEDVEIIQLFES